MKIGHWQGSGEKVNYFFVRVKEWEKYRMRLKNFCLFSPFVLGWESVSVYFLTIWERLIVRGDSFYWLVLGFTLL